MTSKFLRHIACEHCGSKDAGSLYDDGHTHCFSCGVTEHEGAYDERTVMRDAIAPSKKVIMEIKGTVKSIPERGITQQTCEKFGVTTTTIMSIDGSGGEYGSFDCCKPCFDKLWEKP